MNYKIFAIILIILNISILSHADQNVQDQTGRTVYVPEYPKRVVSLAPSITEIIFALGQEHRLKGVTRFSDYPPEAQNFPKVGTYVHLDIEKILALSPDICIAVKDGNPIDVVSRLESLNIPVYAVDPKNLETVMQAVISIGGLLNAEKQADKLVMNMRERINKIKEPASKAKHKPGVFFQIGVSPIVAPGTETFIHELIQTAGGINLSQGKIPYPRFSREQVLALSPEILIITSMARGEIFQQVKAKWEEWPHMPAVKNKRIFIMDSDFLDRPTPRMVQGLESLFKLIHPELAQAE